MVHVTTVLTKHIILFVFMEIKARYSDEDLEEFRGIINDKLKIARSIYNDAMRQLMNADSNNDDDTAPTYKIIEEGTQVIERENLIQTAQRQQSLYKDWRPRLLEFRTRPTE